MKTVYDVAIDVSTCKNIFARKFYTRYPSLPLDFQMSLEYTLGHSHAINRKTKEGKMVLCTQSRLTDIVKCYYLFGETVLETTHKVGQCPWKLMWTPGLKTAVIKK